ncbi:MAG TPA: hypothetical protein VMW76_07910 [Bacteroidales bacterium]|nr:hypothetical protein [Bacteroidales bacterium]
MITKSTILVSAVIFIFHSCVLGQRISSPNFSLKSPETVEVIEVEVSRSRTVVRGSIENRISNGYFCLDRSTYLITENGERLNLTGLTGLPHCPDSHRFSEIGEKVYFSLTFPALPPGTDWIDLIEECGDGCLLVYGITLDQELNTEINSGFRALDRGENEEATELFENLLKELKPSNHALLGSVYLNLITLCEMEDKPERVDQLIKEILSSAIPRRELFLRNLKSMGYEF